MSGTRELEEGLARAPETDQVPRDLVKALENPARTMALDLAKAAEKALDRREAATVRNLDPNLDRMTAPVPEKEAAMARRDQVKDRLEKEVERVRMTMTPR